MDAASIDVLLAQVYHFTKTYSSTEIIWTPLSFTGHLGIISEGNVLVYKNICIGNQLILNQTSAGGLIGMSCVFEDAEQFPAVVQARSNCKILFLPKASLLQLFNLHPPILEKWMQMLCSRIHYLTDKIEMLAIPNAKDRLLWFIGHYASDPNTSLKLSKTNLMQQLSISHASLYRAINSLEDEGYIERTADGSLRLIVHS
jgi:CRP-like cAMP-binding protein